MMSKIIKRLIDLELPEGTSAFLWGPRKVGKTHWIRQNLAETATIIDLLHTDTFAQYVSQPHLLRERYQHHHGKIVIDEIQKIPALLDEIHWLIENSGVSFLLTGSSARKLRRGHANLLGGRAWRRQMMPLSYCEIEGFHLEHALSAGLLPPHYLSAHPAEELRAYVADYLKEEIVAEALAKNIPAFTEFLRVAALTSSELLNYTNLARETGVSARVVRSYVDILEDTYLGFRIAPWRKSESRRMTTTEKFYLFDVGVANHLARRTPTSGSSAFGKAFEHFILMELKAYQAYRQPDMPIRFWRSSSGVEVDFICGDMELAIEIKGSAKVHQHDFRHLRTLCSEHLVRKAVLVSLESLPRFVDGITILPWEQFLQQLWAGELGI